VAYETIHLIVRPVAGGFYVTSPQVPGLAYGRPTMEELRADLDDVLAFALDRPGPFAVEEHGEAHYDVGGRELVIRLAIDDHIDERQEALNRIVRALSVPEQADALVAGPTNLVGEKLYICVVPSDTLGWVGQQLDPRGEAATVAIAIAEELLLTFLVSTDRDHGSVHLDPSRTVADMMKSQPILQPVASTVTV
jgi:hypothetical protein